MEKREVPSLKHCCFGVLLRGCAADFSDISTAHFDLGHIISNDMNEDLQLSFFQYCVAQQRMDDELFQIFYEHCPNIKYQTQLALRSCDITDATLESIQNKFSNLKILDVSGCARLSRPGFNSLPALTSLTELNLARTNITDDSLRALEVLTSLHSLNVLHCPQISYAGVVPLLLSLNDVTDFKCESDKLRPHVYHDEERYYKADPDDESDEDEEDEEDDEFI
eukprot:TRINITY_DN2616_c0_g1_i1.p1 TRINITY_DN2616_c0_g1~~TRINITY_DN2616_c0_g1_i1.p1  ORF type:complete len:243 (+),score=39.77 TRINITY_DN2616_c0_g1_i1:62-730(+)